MVKNPQSYIGYRLQAILGCSSNCNRESLLQIDEMLSNVFKCLLVIGYKGFYAMKMPTKYCSVVC